MDKETYESYSRTVSLLLKVVGVAGILFVPVFWALTGRIEFGFLPFFGTMAGVGEGINILKEITSNRGGGNSSNETSP